MKALTSPYLVLLISLIVIGCSSDKIMTEGNEVHTAGHDESGEESTVQYTIDQTFDQERKGMRLVLKYDKITKAFIGTVENVTSQTILKVRVEIHLSNGVELGPTTPTDLPAGQKLNVKLDATGQNFDKWNAHPERD